MSAPRRWLIAALMAAAAPPAAAGLPGAAADGWQRWQVAAPADAPDVCCSGHGDLPCARTTCNLDAARREWSRRAAAGSGRTSVYARLRDGAVTALRALSADCPVRAEVGIVDLGVVANDASVAWLAARVQPGSAVGADAVAAIALHGGEAAHRFLVRTAAEGAVWRERREAVLWLGLLHLASGSGGDCGMAMKAKAASTHEATVAAAAPCRSGSSRDAGERASETAALLKRLMFDDAEARMREHAAFVWSRADVPGRGEALRRLGEADRDEDVRAAAWFWLAQSADEAAEGAIVAALADEGSRLVRERAIFALSQLPGERGTAALIAVVEDRERRAGDRQRALFWLAQSESERAHAYLSALLAG